MKFKGVVGEDASFMERVFAVQIRILKSVAYSRDCYVAAGVSLCAALQTSDEAAEVFQITQRPNSRLQKNPEALVFPLLKERLLHCIADQSYEAKLIGPLVSNHQISSETTPSKFQKACDVYAYQILEMWFTCIKLLEDEDDLIRSKLATDVQKCFSTAMEVPTQVEKVFELSFNHLSSVFRALERVLPISREMGLQHRRLHTPTKRRQ